MNAERARCRAPEAVLRPLAVLIAALTDKGVNAESKRY
jgi:hypothetical protein